MDVEQSSNATNLKDTVQYNEIQESVSVEEEDIETHSHFSRYY